MIAEKFTDYIQNPIPVLAYCVEEGTEIILEDYLDQFCIADAYGELDLSDGPYLVAGDWIVIDPIRKWAEIITDSIEFHRRYAKPYPYMNSYRNES